ncbi:MAG: phosphatase PAP2 family protein [Treponema sp.]|jgi:membrane-associated phospholipid phosphatase|nr:phosphatase PAP2 family protein [Treponema sp.]
MNGTIGVLAAGDPSFLYDIYWWGVGLIKGIQTIENPVLTVIMKALTTLGTEMFYIPVILFIFWCVDEKQGLRLTILILFSAWINGFFKSLLKQPRPYNLDSSVMRAFEPSYGIPSGHTQQSLVFWGTFLRQALGQTDGRSRRSGFRVLVPAIFAGFFIVAIPFTRLYLGVHFPTDILAGWVLGGIILAVSFVFGDRIASLLSAGGTRPQLIAAAAIALLMNASGADRNLGGMFLGFCGGYSLMRKYVPFAARGPVRGGKPGVFILAARYALGLAGAAVIYLELRRVLPGEASFLSGIPLWGAASPYYELGRFLRYGFLGLWASAGAPWLFLRLGLSGGVAPSEQ